MNRTACGMITYLVTKRHAYTIKFYLKNWGQSLVGRFRVDLMLMAPNVISADNQKDAGETKLLAALIEESKIPDNVMDKAYERCFENKNQEQE